MKWQIMYVVLWICIIHYHKLRIKHYTCLKPFSVALGKAVGQREIVVGREHCSGKEILGAISVAQAERIMFKSKGVWIGECLYFKE